MKFSRLVRLLDAKGSGVAERQITAHFEDTRTSEAFEVQVFQPKIVQRLRENVGGTFFGHFIARQFADRSWIISVECVELIEAGRRAGLTDKPRKAVFADIGQAVTELSVGTL